MSVSEKPLEVLTLDFASSLSTAKSQIFTIITSIFKTKNQKLFILAFFILIPFVGFSNPSLKRTKKIKTVKTIKRNILDIEFGTFNYESPFIAKKSLFLG